MRFDITVPDSALALLQVFILFFVIAIAWHAGRWLAGKVLR